MRDLAEIAFGATGEPVSVSWRGRSYSVTEAIRLEDLAAAITHPPAVCGWRVDVVAEGVPAWRYRLALRPAGERQWAIVTVNSAAGATAA